MLKSDFIHATKLINLLDINIWFFYFFHFFLHDKSEKNNACYAAYGIGEKIKDATVSVYENVLLH